jgi:hypothetical protein
MPLPDKVTGWLANVLRTVREAHEVMFLMVGRTIKTPEELSGMSRKRCQTIQRCHLEQTFSVRSQPESIASNIGRFREWIFKLVFAY